MGITGKDPDKALATASFGKFGEVFIYWRGMTEFKGKAVVILWLRSMDKNGLSMLLGLHFSSRAIYSLPTPSTGFFLAESLPQFRAQCQSAL